MNATPEHRVCVAPRRRTRAAIVTLAITVVAAAAACADADSKAEAVRQATSGDIPRGGELTAAIRDDPPGFNPYVGRSTNVVEVLTRLVHASLVRINRNTGEVEPWLAERWTSSADGLTWILHLRSGVRFSDGTAFTSADVLFALSAVYDAASNTVTVRSSVNGTVQVTGARTAGYTTYGEESSAPITLTANTPVTFTPSRLP